MKLQKTIIIIALVLIGTTTGSLAQGLEVEKQAGRLITAYETAMNQKLPHQVADLFHPVFHGMPRDMLEKILKQSFAMGKIESTQVEIQQVTQKADTLVVETMTTSAGADWSRDANEMFLLQDCKGELKIAGIYQKLASDVYDPITRVLSSTKGQYRMQVPEGWLALQGPLLLKGLTPDSVVIMGPDYRSGVTVGMVQLPLNLGDKETESAHQAIIADMGMEKRSTKDHMIHHEGPTQVAGMDGYEVTVTFSTQQDDGQLHTRRRVYLSDKPMLYFMVCDAVGQGQFEALEPAFQSLLASFVLFELEEGVSRQESLAAEHASGAVTGRVYTSEKYNCFIAVPEGWEMQTSSNPAHLVEMQYRAGKSIARLLAVKGLGDRMTAQKMFEDRLKNVKAIVQDFAEVSQREVTVQGQEGIESVHTFFVEGFGGFHVKEVTVVKDGTYYLILCQCIDPDDFTVLKKDFDQIISSFGFVQ